MLFLVWTVLAQAATIQCPMPTQAGIRSVQFQFEEGSADGQVTYEFNSGIQSLPQHCRVEKLAGTSSLVCRGPARLRENLLTSILISQANELSLRIYDLESPRLQEFSPKGPSANCQIR